MTRIATRLTPRGVVRMAAVVLPAASALAQPNPGRTDHVTLNCPPPCNCICSYEISTSYLYNAGGDLTSVTLCHRRTGEIDRDGFNIAPGSSMVQWTTGGVTTRITLVLPGITNPNDPLAFNNVEAFKNSLEAHGWAMLPNQGENCMRLDVQTVLTGFSASFISNLMCECERVVEDQDPLNTRSTTTTVTYQTPQDHDTGPHDSFDPGTPSQGVVKPRGENFGADPMYYFLYPNESIDPARRIPAGSTGTVVMHLGTPPVTIGPGALLMLRVFNVRDAGGGGGGGGGQADLRAFVNGLEIAGAFDSYDLDYGPDEGGAQEFFLPLDAQIRQRLVSGQAQLVLFNQCQDGQFVALDYAALVLDAPPVCAVDFNGDGFLDFFDADAFALCFEGLGCPPGRDADFNGDGFVDFFDADAFMVAFEAGC